MPLFNNQKVLKIRKVGLRENLRTISKMKNYFSENNRQIYLIWLYRENM